MDQLTEFIERLRSWENEYQRDVLPLRIPADQGIGSYDRFDEAYGDHLELLHDMVGAFLHENKRRPPDNVSLTDDQAQSILNNDNLAHHESAELNGGKIHGWRDHETGDLWARCWARIEKGSDSPNGDN